MAGAWVMPPGPSLSISTSVQTPVLGNHLSDDYTWHGSSKFYILTTSRTRKLKNKFVSRSPNKVSLAMISSQKHPQTSHWHKYCVYSDKSLGPSSSLGVINPMWEAQKLTGWEEMSQEDIWSTFPKKGEWIQLETKIKRQLKLYQKLSDL